MWWKKRAYMSWSAAAAPSKSVTGTSEKNTLNREPTRLIVAGMPLDANACASPAVSSCAACSSAGYGSSERARSSAAMPAATATGLPLRVPAW